MIQRIEQTDTTPENGNCFSACISMITGIPLEKIPVFKGKGWWGDAAQWLLERDWGAILVIKKAEDEGNACVWAFANLNLPMILSGQSPRHDCLHAVVRADGKIYDPHPDQTGFIGDHVDVVILVPKFAYTTGDPR